MWVLSGWGDVTRMVIFFHTSTLPFVLSVPIGGWQEAISSLSSHYNYGAWIRNCGPEDLALIRLCLFCLQLRRWRGFIMHTSSPSLYITGRSREESMQILAAKQWTYTSHSPTSRSRSNFWRGLCFTMERHDKTTIEYASRLWFSKTFLTPHHPYNILWMQCHEVQRLPCQVFVTCFQRKALTCLNSRGKHHQAKVRVYRFPAVLNNTTVCGCKC